MSARETRPAPETLRVVVVDDEPLAREGLATYLTREPGVEVVAQCSDGYEAIDRIRDHDPDLVFLDIQMPELSGFDIIEAIGVHAMPAVVFVTAYDEYALQAFDACAVDYVLKPIEPDRIGRALERTRRLVDRRGSADVDERVERLLERMEPHRSRVRRFAVRHGSKIRFVDVGDIRWIEAAGNYAVLHAGDEDHRVRCTMSALERKLDPSEFVRIHRSAFVRIDRIREMEPLYQGDYLVILDDGTRLTSSRSCRENLRQLMDGISS